MDYFAMIMELINIIPKIQDALRQGGSVLDIIKRLAPDLLPFIQQIGTQIFPTVDPNKAIQAGIDVIFDKDGTMWVQNQLNTLGQSPALAVDGSYGPMTKAAVSAYQTKKGLVVDGWAGPKTSAALAIDVAKLTP